MMKFVLPAVAAFAVIAIGTYDEGLWTERWGRRDSSQLDAFTSRLKSIPTVVGRWESVEKPVDKQQFVASNCDGYFSRDYTDRRDPSRSVSVFVVSGFGRHVTMHDPEWCYQGAGYKMLRRPSQYTFEIDGFDPQPEALTTSFTKADVATGNQRLRIFWTFTDDGNWQGPKSATDEFGIRPAVYKIYFISNEPSGGRAENSPTVDFVKDFLPAVNQALFPPGWDSPAPKNESDTFLEE